MTVLEPLAVPAGPAVLELLPRLARALDGRPVAPYAAGSPPPALPLGVLPNGLAVVVGTSGSTGSPKRALLGAEALRASGTATHDVLGGPGTWLLTMPAHHVAGLQVLLRSLLAGTTPAVLDTRAPFTAQRFTAACDFPADGPRYTALVPTQLARLLDDPEATEALAGFDAVLVGGAGMPGPLRVRAAAAGIRVVPTYGMSETCGGCVYAGRALPGSHVRVEGDRVLLGGATLADGYLGRPDLTEAAFVVDRDGRRWFRTDDAGRLDADGELHIEGRLDDLVNTGGLKVAPRLVEEAILDHLPEVREAVVVGIPDPQWGQALCAALVVVDGRPTPTVADVRAALRAHLPAHALPRHVQVVAELPLRGPGKPDRAALTCLFAVGQ